METVTVLLVLFIFVGGLVDLYPNKRPKLNCETIAEYLLSFFVAGYIIYYFFNALNFGFELTYPQILFIMTLVGKLNFKEMIKKQNEEVDYFEKQERIRKYNEDHKL